MKRLFSLRFLPPLLGIGLILWNPAAAKEGFRSGLTLCAELLIPALFPVGVLARCLLGMDFCSQLGPLLGPFTKRFWGISGNAAAPILLGFMGGFPLGAQLLSTQYREKKLTKQEAIRVSALCNNAGPGFLIGAAGPLLGSQGLGIALLGIQLLSVFIVGCLFKEPYISVARQKSPRQTPAGLFQALPSAIGASAMGMLRLCGSVAFFRVLTACAEPGLSTLRLSPLGQAVVTGFLELSGGAALWGQFRQQTAFVLASVLIGWGGLCVHLQAAQAFREAELPMKRYLWGKLLQALSSALLACWLLSLLEQSYLVSVLWLIALAVFLSFFIFTKKLIGKRQHLCYNEKNRSGRRHYAVS